MGGEKKGAISLSDFHIEKSGKVISCPEGHAPMHSKKKKTRYCAAFDSAHCNNCPNQGICPATSGKKGFYIRFTDKQLRVALRRAEIQTETFKDRYRWRAGVEATMSEYDRRTGVKHFWRVRGYKAVRFSARLKALGLNILRAAAMIAEASPATEPKGGCRAAINDFKEQFWAAFCFFARSLGCSPNVLSICSKHGFC